MFILFIVHIVVSKNNCPLYRCSPDYLFLSEITCAFFDDSRYTPGYYIQSCPDPSFPVCNFTQNQNSTCISRNSSSPSSASKPAGSKCKSDSDCLSQSCLSHICSGKPSGSKCKSNQNCNPGLFCSSNICIGLKAEGSSCKFDFECSSSSGCLNRKCTKYRSLKSGDSIETCDEFGESFFCETGKCEKDKCTAVKKNKSLPEICLKDEDCPSVCECGKNRNANRFCRLEAGDAAYSEYLSLNQEFLASGRNILCNSEIKTSFECAADWWDLGKALRMKELSYFVHNYAVIVEFDECVHDLFIPDYPIEELMMLNHAILITFTLITFI